MEELKKIIEWLIYIETLAESFYEKAAHYFIEDSDITGLINRLWRDEGTHLQILKRAQSLINSDSCSPLKKESAFKLDEDLANSYAARLKECEKKIGSNGFGKNELINLIIEIEFSEWNSYFVYAVDYLKHSHPEEFISAAAMIEQHKKTILRYLKARPHFGEYYKKIQTLPRLWKENILVVDDEEMITDALKVILEDEGAVVTASNGRDALEKLMKKHYEVVITDIEMPVMNGVEFYKKAVGAYPSISHRFIFFSGAFSAELVGFLSESKIRFLIKPVGINAIKDAVVEVLSGRI